MDYKGAMQKFCYQISQRFWKGHESPAAQPALCRSQLICLPSAGTTKATTVLGSLYVRGDVNAVIKDPWHDKRPIQLHCRYLGLGWSPGYETLHGGRVSKPRATPKCLYCNFITPLPEPCEPKSSDLGSETVP